MNHLPRAPDYPRHENTFRKWRCMGKKERNHFRNWPCPRFEKLIVISVRLQSSYLNDMLSERILVLVLVLCSDINRLWRVQSKEDPLHTPPSDGRQLTIHSHVMIILVNSGGV